VVAPYTPGVTVLLYVLGILVIVVGIALSIGLHEVGHLVPAKLFGVRVTQYMIGFGRTVFSRTRGETQYGLKMIPLGGFISMVGMFPPAKAGRRARVFQPTVGEAVEAAIEPDERRGPAGFVRGMVDDARTSSQEQIRPGEDHRAFYRLPVWKRIVIMLGGPAMNLILGILFFGIAMVGIGSYAPTTTVASVSQCLVPATSTSTTCTSSDAAAPAAAAGLKPGDTVVAVDGRAVSSWTAVTTVIRASAGTPVQLQIRRAGAVRSLTLTPVATAEPVVDSNGVEVKNADGTVATKKVGVIGLTSTEALTPEPVTAVLPAVLNNVTTVGGVILHLPERLVSVVQATFGNGVRNPNGPISVVGVGEVAGQIASSPNVTLASKAAGLIGILGSLNIALFTFNLIPLLPLDGGHVIGALWEGIRRTVAKLFRRRDPGPVDTAKLMPLTFVVAILLGGMSVLLIAADLIHPVNLF
jgi:membrane-associated protease RseP (regulator of RpoE activity)